MDWNEVIISVATADTETAEAIAQMVVPHGIYIEDYSDLLTEAPKIAHIDLIDETLLSKPTDVSLIHIYFTGEENLAEAVSFLTERLAAADVDCKIEKFIVKEEDWAHSWKKYYHPIRIGKNIVIRPEWEEYSPLANDVVVTLDPGPAFGTGSHETTRLCLTLMEKYMPQGARLLDIGTGSGILAVAGVLLGAQSADGVDIDENAVRAAESNSALNRTTDKTRFIAGNLTDKIDGRFEFVTANIVADIIISLLENLEDFMQPGARAVLSGIIDIREPDVLTALEKFGFRPVEFLRENGWTAVLIEQKISEVE